LDTDTIIGAEFMPRTTTQSMILGTEQPIEFNTQEDQRLFKIKTAKTDGQRSSATVLINRMYASRGYRTSAVHDEPPPTRITLTATESEATIGTITVGFDSPSGLLVDELFAAETAALRDAGRRICEFTKLAMDTIVQSKRVLASLFHVAYVCAHRLLDCDDLLIEVNPRHVRFYERMLGFTVCGPERMNPRVNAPAVLMRLRLEHARDQINRFAGWPERAEGERSLYPLFFSAPEEASIFGRLRGRESIDSQRDRPASRSFWPFSRSNSPALLTL
jgi:hypothetical protein